MLNTEKLLALGKEARTSNKMLARRINADTLDDTREKTANKLTINADYLAGITSDCKDFVYKGNAAGEYSIGIKCGHMWLRKIFNGDDYLLGYSKEEAIETLRQLAKDVKACELDEAIENARKLHAANRKGGARQ